MLGKGGNKLWTILISTYWTKANSFEIVDHANLLDGFSSTIAKGDTIGTQHIQQILDAYLNIKDELDIGMRIWFVSNFLRLKEQKTLVFPPEIFTEAESEIMQLDFNNLKLPRGLVLRLKLIIDKSSALKLLKPKIERLVKP
jgi:hypothetical protein